MLIREGYGEVGDQECWDPGSIMHLKARDKLSLGQFLFSHFILDTWHVMLLIWTKLKDDKFRVKILDWPQHYKIGIFSLWDQDKNKFAFSYF